MADFKEDMANFINERAFCAPHEPTKEAKLEETVDESGRLFHEILGLLAPDKQSLLWEYELTIAHYFAEQVETAYKQGLKDAVHLLKVLGLTDKREFTHCA